MASFEIQVAVIGPVSAGKSTLINALLLGKYSDVAVRRTTAGVNYFRLTPDSEVTAEVTTEEVASTPPAKRARRTTQQEEILLQITSDNQRLREEGETNVSQRTFEVPGVDLLPCRADTQVVLVDVPGINEAESSSKYRDFVAEQWHAFDCVLLVMDSRQGVNTEEQIHVLEFVNRQLATKSIPVIVVFNKVDELDLQEEDNIIAEARAKVASIFQNTRPATVPQNLPTTDPILEEQIPQCVKARFGQIHFSMRNKYMLPCLVLSPYSVPPGPVREKWFDRFQRLQNKDQLEDLTNICYWYGYENEPDKAYSLLPTKNLFSYSDGIEMGYDKLSESIQKKVDSAKPLRVGQQKLVTALQKMTEDLDKPPQDRRGDVSNVDMSEPAPNPVSSTPIDSEVAFEPDVAQAIVQKKINRSEWKNRPIFVPLSARNGYIYRLAQVEDEVRFQHLEQDLVEALGKEQLGRLQWNKLKPEERFDAAFRAISQPDVYQDGIQSSNFETLLAVLRFCVGGESTQNTLLEHQIQKALERFDHRENIAQQLESFYDQIKLFPHLEDTEILTFLQETFWRQFELVQTDFKAAMKDPFPYCHGPLQELSRYHSLATKAKWKEEQAYVIERAKGYLNIYVNHVLASVHQRSHEITADAKVDWSEYNQHAKDTFHIRQLGVMSPNSHYANHFSSTSAIVDMEYHRAMQRLTDLQFQVCKACKEILPGDSHYQDNSSRASGRGCVILNGKCPRAKCHTPSKSKSPKKSTPTKASKLERSKGGYMCTNCNHEYSACGVVLQPAMQQHVYDQGGWHVKLPNGTLQEIAVGDMPPSDPLHWGHPFWLFCQWMDSIEQ